MGLPHSGVGLRVTGEHRLRSLRGRGLPPLPLSDDHRLVRCLGMARLVPCRADREYVSRPAELDEKQT